LPVLGVGSMAKYCTRYKLQAFLTGFLTASYGKIRPERCSDK
jgi:hypothetical protein